MPCCAGLWLKMRDRRFFLVFSFLSLLSGQACSLVADLDRYKEYQFGEGNEVDGGEMPDGGEQAETGGSDGTADEDPDGGSGGEAGLDGSRGDTGGPATDGKIDLENTDCVIRVSAERIKRDEYDVTDWDTAYRNIEDAIDEANRIIRDTSDVQACQIWVAEGTYYIYKYSPTDTVQLAPGIALIGGFRGTETTIEERGYDSYTPTILDGHDGPLADGSTEGDGGIEERKQVFHVVTGSADSRIEGFTITGGNASGYEEYAYGGGIYNENSSFSVYMCTIRDNFAERGGGGMYNSGGSPFVSYSSFVDNSTNGFGGGMYNSDSSPLVSYVTFEGNRARSQGFGGGMYNSNSSFEMMEGVFRNNTAGEHGGGMYNSGGSYYILYTEFIGNSAGGYGGGMYDEASTTLYYCTFRGNTAGASGGGLYNTSGMTVDRATFALNSADSGGGIHTVSSLFTVNSLFLGNSAYSGGGLRCHGSSPAIVNCTFLGNSAEHGGGMLNSASSPTISNCIVWDNSPTGIEDTEDSVPIVSYSDIQDEYAKVGAGNISVDPAIANYPAGSGDWEEVGYDGDKTSLTDNDQAPQSGWYIRPNTDNAAWFEIEGIKENTVYIKGDATGLVTAGDTYEIYNEGGELAVGSPCIDAAEGSIASSHDGSLNPRVDDPATPNTGFPPEMNYVDMGANEYQPW
jgi:hypothetical protein